MAVFCDPSSNEFLCLCRLVIFLVELRPIAMDREPGARLLPNRRQDRAQEQHTSLSHNGTNGTQERQRLALVLRLLVLRLLVLRLLVLRLL